MAPLTYENQPQNPSGLSEAFSVFGLSHKTAPLAVREKLAWNDQELEALYQRLLAHPEIRGTLILSTCNRVEVYTVAEHPQRIKGVIREEFLNRLEAADSDEYFYWRTGYQAVEHLVRVASGLDSMVLGEPQITGQVKEAYTRALRMGMNDATLNQVAHRTFRIAKKIRTETDIQRQPVSVPYTAVLLAEQIFGDLSSKRVLLIGAGDMSELAAHHLVERKLEGLLIANRTADKAQTLAQQFLDEVPCEVLALETMTSRLDEADIVVSSTSAHEVQILEEHVREAMRRRKNRPMFFIDLGVPRDIDPTVNNVMNAYLFDIDDLQQVVDDNLGERQRAAKEAEQLIRDELADFHKYLVQRDLSPLIRELMAHLGQMQAAELEKNLPKISGAQSRSAGCARTVPGGHDEKDDPSNIRVDQELGCRAQSGREGRDHCQALRNETINSECHDK